MFAGVLETSLKCCSLQQNVGDLATMKIYIFIITIYYYFYLLFIINNTIC